MLYEDLMTLFQAAPKEEGRGAWKYIIQERNDKYEIVNEMLKNQMSVELYFNEYDEVKITLYKEECLFRRCKELRFQKLN